MNPRQQLQRYIADTLGITLRLKRWHSKRLPLFLTERYELFRGHLLELECLFTVDKMVERLSPAVIRKHIDQIQTGEPAPAVYVRSHITAYNRKRLIEQHVPFVVPGNQLYLPMLGIDLREHFKKLQAGTQELSPSAQVVLLHALLHSTTELKAVELAPTLGYSAMTISRAFDQLETFELARSEKTGRVRRLLLATPSSELWEHAQAVLRSPVKRRHHALPKGSKLPGLRASLSALAQCSALAEPATEVIALTPNQWNVARRSGRLTEVPTHDAGVIEVELWSYAPAILADDVVDPLSLYLSLRESDDERVQAALDEMMGTLQWQ